MTTFKTLLLSSVLFTFGYSKPFVNATSNQTSKIQWIDCASNIPDALNGNQLELPSPLPSTLQCGRLDVPMDYTKPISSENKITLGFSMHRPENPLGLVNFNPGGPGGEASSFGWQVALNLSQGFWFKGVEEFDFLAIDVRGTYSSNPLNCTPSTWVFPASLPTNETEFKSRQAVAAEYAQSCIDNTTPKGFLSHLGSENTVDDWNSVRAALGYDKFHFLGWSYGTHGGAIYAQKKNIPSMWDTWYSMPTCLRAFNADFINDQLKSVNRLLLRSDTYCINDTSCPFHSEGKGSIVKAFGEVISRAKSGNASVTVEDVRIMTALNYLTSTPHFPALNLALSEALNGNWSAFSFAQIAPFFTPSIFGILPTACQDLHIENNTFAGWNALREGIRKYDPAQIDFASDLALINLCGGWPYTAKSNNKVPVNVPAVFVTADFDQNTPTEWTTFEWNQSPKTSLIVRHGDNHGTIPLPSPARDAEFEFLKTGIQPKPRNETFVTIYPPGSKRAPIADPYLVPVGEAAGDNVVLF